MRSRVDWRQFFLAVIVVGRRDTDQDVVAESTTQLRLGAQTGQYSGHTEVGVGVPMRGVRRGAGSIVGG